MDLLTILFRCPRALAAAVLVAAVLFTPSRETPASETAQSLDIHLLVDFSFPPNGGSDDRESLIEALREVLSRLRLRSGSRRDYVRLRPFASRVSEEPLWNGAVADPFFTPDNLIPLTEMALPSEGQHTPVLVDIGNPKVTDFVNVLQSFVDRPPRPLSPQHSSVILIVSNGIDDPDNTRGCHEPAVQVGSREWHKQVQRKQALHKVVNALRVRTVLLAVPCLRLPASSRTYGTYPLATVLWSDARPENFTVNQSWPSFPSGDRRTLQESVDDAIKALQPRLFLRVPSPAPVYGANSHVVFTLPGQVLRSLDAVVCLTTSERSAGLVPGHHLFFGHPTAPQRCKDVRFKLNAEEHKIEVGFEPRGVNGGTALQRPVDAEFVFTFTRHSASSITDSDWRLLMSPAQLPATLQYKFPTVAGLSVGPLYDPRVVFAFVVLGVLSTALMTLSWLHRTYGLFPSTWEVTTRFHPDPSAGSRSGSAPVAGSQSWNATGWLSHHRVHLTPSAFLDVWPLGRGRFVVRCPSGATLKIQRSRFGADYVEMAMDTTQIVEADECCDATPLRLIPKDQTQTVGVSLACTRVSGRKARLMRWLLSASWPTAQKCKWTLFLTVLAYFILSTWIVGHHGMEDQWSGFAIIAVAFPLIKLAVLAVRKLHKVELIDHALETVMHAVRDILGGRTHQP